MGSACSVNRAYADTEVIFEQLHDSKIIAAGYTWVATLTLEGFPNEAKIVPDTLSALDVYSLVTITDIGTIPEGQDMTATKLVIVIKETATSTNTNYFNVRYEKPIQSFLSGISLSNMTTSRLGEKIIRTQVSPAGYA